MINKLICQMLCLDASGAQIEQISYAMLDANTKGRGILSQILLVHKVIRVLSALHVIESLRPRTKPAVVEESRNGAGQLKLLLLKGVRGQKQWDHFSVILICVI